MKHFKEFIMILLLITINSCNNSTEPISSNTFGETTIEAESIGPPSVGFSFSLGNNIAYPNEQKIFPDILAGVLYSKEHEIIGVAFISGVNFTKNFYLVDEFNEPDSALIYFNNLDELPDSNYIEAAHPVLKNQIWAVKTVQGNYGKILILESKAYTDSSNSEHPVPFGLAKFKWVYQPNGSNKF